MLVRMLRFFVKFRNQIQIFRLWFPERPVFPKFLDDRLFLLLLSVIQGRARRDPRFGDAFEQFGAQPAFLQRRARVFPSMTAVAMMLVMALVIFRCPAVLERPCPALPHTFNGQRLRAVRINDMIQVLQPESVRPIWEFVTKDILRLRKPIQQQPSDERVVNQVARGWPCLGSKSRTSKKFSNTRKNQA